MNKERKLAFEAIESERNYQEERWSNPRSSIEETTLFCNNHIQNAMKLSSTLDLSFENPENRDMVLSELRKVAALCVACFEEYGVPVR